MRLDDPALERKLAAANAYSEITGDVQSALGEMGAEAFCTECLRPVGCSLTNAGLAEYPPFYERYGEKQIAAGHYERVLRYREHVAPLIEALALYVAELDK